MRAALRHAPRGSSGVQQRGGCFAVVAQEYGHTRRPLPTWACTAPGNVALAPEAVPAVEARAVPGVPGGFQLLHVLSPEECDAVIAVTEELGYDPDAPVSLPYSVRHMHNVNWIVHPSIDAALWARVAPALPEHAQAVAEGADAVGLNARFRCYRYSEGDYFKPHTDGSWPGSRAVDGALVRDAYPGERWSQFTFLLLLSDDYDGGCTEFHVGQGTAPIRVRTPRGAALCFPHGGHPLHALHAGEEVTRGRKYMVRTEILYKRTAEADALQRGWLH
eukprot:TRINITY_DN12126_c0_g1_i1.p1 TRINITY_DN12126_c0_g1~~TRINITY_DN12126_c0_g1_i1.p1  ORF type:complete len:276 (+),score=63.12 TRINITY_DN12126_c0_g1_i1:102-929(+)